jgi:hypothetical protein
MKNLFHIPSSENSRFINEEFKKDPYFEVVGVVDVPDSEVNNLEDIVSGKSILKLAGPITDVPKDVQKDIEKSLENSDSNIELLDFQLDKRGDASKDWEIIS